MINTRNALIALIALALPTLAPSGSPAQDPDWPQWLGPQRNGISPEPGLFGARPTREEVWRVARQHGARAARLLPHGSGTAGRLVGANGGRKYGRRPPQK